MSDFTEEIKREVTLTDDGHIMVRIITSVFKDGIFHSSSNHRPPIIKPEDKRPQDIIDFINAKKVKQPKKVK